MLPYLFYNLLSYFVNFSFTFLLKISSSCWYLNIKAGGTILVYLDVPLSFPSNILCIRNLCVIMLLFCKAILKYLLYQLGTGGINKWNEINEMKKCSLWKGDIFPFDRFTGYKKSNQNQFGRGLPYVCICFNVLNKIYLFFSSLSDFDSFSWRVHLSYGVRRLRARVQLKTLSSLL